MPWRKELPVELQWDAIVSGQNQEFTVITDHSCQFCRTIVVSSNDIWERRLCKGSHSLGKAKDMPRSFKFTLSLSLDLRIFRTVEAYHLQLWSWKLLDFIVTGKNPLVLAISSLQLNKCIWTYWPSPIAWSLPWSLHRLSCKRSHCIVICSLCLPNSTYIYESFCILGVHGCMK